MAKSKDKKRPPPDVRVDDPPTVPPVSPAPPPPPPAASPPVSADPSCPKCGSMKIVLKPLGLATCRFCDHTFHRPY